MDLINIIPQILFLCGTLCLGCLLLKIAKSLLAQNRIVTYKDTIIDLSREAREWAELYYDARENPPAPQPEVPQQKNDIVKICKLVLTSRDFQSFISSLTNPPKQAPEIPKESPEVY